jgi:hypothetical protein
MISEEETKEAKRKAEGRDPDLLKVHEFPF